MNKLAKRALSLISALVMTASGALGSISAGVIASADDSRIYEYSYNWSRYASLETEEKELTLYYLEDPIVKLGYSVPKNLPTSCTLPEWEDYTWSASDIGFYIDPTEFRNGNITVSAREKKYVTKAFQSSDYYYTDNIYGVSNDRTKRIHYTVKFYNYANKLREQKVAEWVKNNITSDMTTRQKVEAVVRKTTYGAYQGGCDVVLSTSDGDCIDYSISALYFFQALGLPARVRTDYFTLTGDGMHLTSFSNHHNNWVMIDGELYIVECTPWGNKTTEGYLSSITANLENVSKNTGGVMTDGKYAYFLLADGTLELYDIVNLTYELPEVWTVPNQTVINGKTYKISRLGPIGHLTTCYTDFPTVKEIVISKGVTFDPDYGSCISESWFPNLKKLTLNEDINTISHIRGNMLIDATMATIDTVMDNSYSSIYHLEIDGTAYGNFGKDVMAAYKEDTEEEWASYYLCNISDPNNCALTINVPDASNDSLVLNKDSHNFPSKLTAFSVKNGSYYFPGLEPGAYTAKYTNADGEERSFPITVTGKKMTFNITNSMLYSTFFLIDARYYIPNATLDAVTLTDKNGKSYPVTRDKRYYYGFNADLLPDGTYEMTAHLPYWPDSKTTVTIQNGKPAEEQYTFNVYKYGDVNHDNKVNLEDYSDLAKYIAEWDGYENTVDPASADLNGSGAPDLDDLSILAKCIAEWDGYNETYIDRQP
ncbi:MAG: hypothetical protein IKP95_12460 [Ruminococcus sp.]|nr:hypothetical protein [Ruminococcus sp.]